MPTWLLALFVKPLLFVGIAFLYWLIAIKGSEWIGKLIPSEKWRRILTEPRYDFNWKNPRREPYPTHRPSQLERPESRDGR